jgi:hypothetical protein
MATITSNQSGDWASTSTWVGGSVPAADDLVVISHGHKVTVSTNIQSTRTGDVTINGNLHFANGGKMHLHGRMTVYNTSNSNNSAGEFVEGSTSSGSLLSMTGGSEIKISGSNSDQHGIQIQSRKWCGVELLGSEPTLYTNLNGNHPTFSDYLTADSVSNFAAGDMISLYEREVDYRMSPDECFWIHDVDSSNNRLYVRHFVSPQAVIQSKSGSAITVDDAAVFRIGYKIVFGTGSNRNLKEITNIEGNVITFGSAVAGTVDGLTAYQSATEKYHPDNRIIRRLSTSITTAITALDSTNQIVVGNASDLNVGDEIVLEASTDDGTYNYASGSENNVWRHNLLYTISAKSGNTLTLDRNIMYKSDVGCVVTCITRDIVIKACKTDGTDVPDGDESSARVFFNVRYWTSTSWYDAPTRRVKIKYVQFKGLGYNTNDSTNFRAGVTIAGYNGRYRTDLTGSGADESTIHTSGGISQTGENYMDGCTYTAYNLCSNSTRDGDSYPSLCVRHPYGHVDRNCVTVGTARGYWRWSSGYYIKASGMLNFAGNYSNTQIEAMYGEHNYAEYFYNRMAEDYGFMIYHCRQNNATSVRHIDVRHQQSYAFYFGNNLQNAHFDRWYADKYRYTYQTDSITDVYIHNSRFMPNQWDGSSAYYNGVNGKIYAWNVYHDSNTNYDAWRSGGGNGIVRWNEHRFKTDEYVEQHHRFTRIQRAGTTDWDILIQENTYQSYLEKVYVPANTVVKIKSQWYVNPQNYLNTGAASLSDNDYPVLIARPINGDLWRIGRYETGDFGSGSESHSFSYSTLTSYGRNSTEAQGKLREGFIEYVRHTSASIGAWESKEITVAAQKESYWLSYGYFAEDQDGREEGAKMKDFEVAFSVASPQSYHSKGTGKKSVRTSFNSGKKRIGGTRL